MQSMSKQETREFLLAGGRTGKLATVRADGRPHIAPIWYDLEGDDIVFTSWHASVKTTNMRRAGRAALCVDDEVMPYAYVLVEGKTAFLDVTPEELLYWATRLAGRYMDSELAKVYGRRNGIPGELFVRLTPTHVVALRGIAD